MDQKQLWTIIIIAAIVAVIASLITAAVTGSAIFSPANVYAKSNQAVLGMLSKCEVVGAPGGLCSDICKQRSKTCVAGFAIIMGTLNGGDGLITMPVSCSQKDVEGMFSNQSIIRPIKDIDIYCNCCKP